MVNMYYVTEVELNRAKQICPIGTTLRDSIDSAVKLQSGEFVMAVDEDLISHEFTLKIVEPYINLMDTLKLYDFKEVKDFWVMMKRLDPRIIIGCMLRNDRRVTNEGDLMYYQITIAERKMRKRKEAD